MRVRASSLVTVALFLVAPVAAQDVLLDLHTGNTTTVVGGADLDGDGIPDAVLGVVIHQTFVHPYVEARSGLDGSTLWQSEAPKILSQFGSALEFVGDVDGDGVQDVLVGAPAEFNSGELTGAAYLLSGVDGATRVAWQGAVDAGLGSAVSAAGDLDGDGAPDLLMASNGVSAGAGRVTLVSGASAQELVSLVGESLDDEFGSDVAGIGDVDGNGVLEVAIGAPGAEPGGWPADADVGSVSVHSGAALVRRARVFETMFDGRLGRRVSAVGDTDSDGLPDVLATKHGGVLVLRGLDLGVIDELPAVSAVPEIVSPGDVDGDGRDDVLIGTPSLGGGGKTLGLVELWSVAGEVPLLRITDGDLFTHFGRSLSAAGDVNRDGIPDIAVGASGSASIVSGRLRPVQKIGGSLDGSSSAPTLDSAAGLGPANQVSLDVSGGPADATGWLVFGSSLAAKPYQGGVLLPAPDVVMPVSLDAAGTLEFRVVFPASVPAGALVLAQGWFVDAGGPAGFVVTNGLSIVAP